MHFGLGNAPNALDGWPSAFVRVRQIVLSQQVLPIIVPIWCAHHAMNMLPRRHIGVFRELRQVCRPLVVEFNQNYRALNPVVEHTVILHSADPCKPGVLDVLLHFAHLYPRVFVIHVAYVQFRRLAHNGHEVQPFAEKYGVPSKFRKSLVQTHHISRQLESSGAERCPHQAESQFAL